MNRAEQQGLPADHCGDCGVAPGTAHEVGCDVARCLWTGGQRIQCDGGLTAECCRALVEAGKADLAEELEQYLGLEDSDHDCGGDIWTGEWPSSADAAALGFWTRWGPPWITCLPDHPDARPDLNRLVTEARWDRSMGHWVKR